MARQPRNSTVTQLIVAMAVVLVPISAVVWFFTRTPQPFVQPVDWRPVARQAAAAASYQVLGPQGLPEGWVATRARWTPTGGPLLGGVQAPGDTWQLGMLSPQQTYVALDQRDVAPDEFVRDVTRQGHPDGESSVAGVAWQRYVSTDGRTRSLVWRGQAVTIVSGDLPYEALAAFASTLQQVER